MAAPELIALSDELTRSEDAHRVAFLSGLLRLRAVVATHGRGSSRAASILLVEDSPADARLTVEGLRDADEPAEVHVVPDAEQAIERIRRTRPDLVLLDLNLPGRSGRELLVEVKADPVLRTIPVVVLSSSRNPDDICSCYEAGGNCYVIKPLELDAFLDMVAAVAEFWLGQAARCRWTTLSLG